MMKMSKITPTIISLFFCTTLFSQMKERGNVNLHFGSLAVYSTYSVGYESPYLLSKDKHHLTMNMRLGGWSASVLNKNNGSLTSVGGTYLFGNKHCLEFSSDLVFHFDKGLKGQPLTYIGTTYRPFLGYRWQNPENRFLARFGVGWYEIIQFGIGFKI